MNKQLLRTALVTLGITAAMSCSAAAMPKIQDTTSFTGVFAGIDLGFRVVDYTIKHTRNGTEADDIKLTSSVTQATQGIHLGYGYEFNNHLYLGAKGIAMIAQGKDKETATFGSSIGFGNDLEFRSLYGVNLNLGYALTERLLPYLSGGYEWLKAKNRVTNEFGSSEMITVSKYMNGPDLGLGVHYLIAPHLMIDAEYSANWFNTIKQSTTSAGVADVLKLQASPVMMGTIGFSYLF